MNLPLIEFICSYKFDGGMGGSKSFNQKLSLKFLKVVNFASRFLIIIENMNFEFKFY
jgi:hypothetical protein